MNKKKTILLIFSLIIFPILTVNYYQITFSQPKEMIIEIDYNVNNPITTPDIGSFFSLVLKSTYGFEDYAYYMKQQLKDIGIDVDVEIQDWLTFLDTILLTSDFDLTTISFSGGDNNDPGYLPNAAYTENASLNIWGYNDSMDWNTSLGMGLNEWYLKQGLLMMPPNSQERIEHYWEWQQYFMDELLMLLPLFSRPLFSANWDNLIGYNYSKSDILQNWGHLSWNGLHIGQESTNEFVIRRNNNWFELNPLFQGDSNSKFIIDFCLDKLIYKDQDHTFWPHLANSWNFINDTTLDITLRDDVQWMDYGGFTNEFLDVKDLFFTLFCFANLSVDISDYMWIKDMEIIDDMTLRIYIDGDIITPENDVHTDCLEDLNVNILPEHFLNQTQLIDGITPDITHASWIDYSTNCWGTGLFKIDSFIEDDETNLTVRPNCWLLDPLVDKSNMDFINRFGDFTGGLSQIRIRVIENSYTTFSEFETGKIDFLEVTDMDRIHYYEQNVNFDVQTKKDDYFNFYGFNVRESRGTPLQSMDPCPLMPTITKGLAIRKAISYVINQTEMNHEFLDNTYYINYCPNFDTYGNWSYKDIIKYDYNLTKAKEYMMYAGFDCGLDSDSDGLTDYVELSTTNTDRFNSDTDSDLMPDSWEVNNGLDPLVDNADYDEDSDDLTNLEEYTYNTDPNDSDTDNDFMDDNWEVKYNLNPLIDDALEDQDNDYLTNLMEYLVGTIPIDADTDKDLLLDGCEVNGIYSPSNPGADIDGYVFTNPLQADSDSDGYIDSVELYSDSDPNDLNSYPMPEIITITPPTETITENNTVTATVTSGIIFGVSIATISTALIIIVFITRKVRKK